MRYPGRGREIVVRLFIERDERHILRALDERCPEPERAVDAGNETDIRRVVTLVGNTAGAPPPAPPRPSAKAPAWYRPPHRYGRRVENQVRPMAAQSGGERF